MKIPRLIFPLPKAVRLLPLLLLLLAACRTVPPPVTLAPVAADTRWLLGKEFALSTDSSASVAIAFDRYRDGRVYFDLEITNLSSASVLVSPEGISAQPWRDAARTSRIDTMIAVVDPEQELRNIDARSHGEENDYAAHQNGRVVDAVVTGVVAIAVLAMDGTSTSDSAQQAQQAARDREYRRRDEDHRNRLQDLNASRREWEVAFRKTTLGPGEVVRGRIAFPAYREAGAFTISVPVGGMRRSFVFRQIVDPT